MTKAEIDELRALEQASDKMFRKISGVSLREPRISVSVYNRIGDDTEPNFRKMLSLANQYIPGLLDEVERLTAELERYRKDEADGRIVRLPCKVGDTVYVYVDDIRGNQPHKIDLIEIYGHSSMTFHAKLNHRDAGWEDTVEFDKADVGETIFPVREEAEAALKAQEVSHE